MRFLGIPVMAKMGRVNQVHRARKNSSTCIFLLASIASVLLAISLAIGQR